MGLSRYLEEIRRFPMLEPDQEYMLAKRWQEHGDSDAAEQLARYLARELGNLSGSPDK